VTATDLLCRLLGKSTVSSLLKAREIPLIDLDILARQAVEPGSRGFKSIVKIWGDKVLKEDGSLDRAKLGEIVFNNQEERKRLNGIVHPEVSYCFTSVSRFIDSLGFGRFGG
jgi:dephospho-CoA kinase